MKHKGTFTMQTSTCLRTHLGQALSRSCFPLLLMFLFLGSWLSAQETVPLEGSPLDYPCWRGATGSGAAAPCGDPLVESLTEAKLVWATRGMMPNCYPEGCSNTWQSRQGGQAGPVVADGKVYIWFYELTGEAPAWVYYKALMERLKTPKAAGHHKIIKGIQPGEDLAEVVRKRCSLVADEVILCLDAATGAVLWRQSFPGEGVNHAPSGQCGNIGAPKVGPHGKPCVAYGKACAQGTMGQLYCVDAISGEPLWKRNGSDFPLSKRSNDWAVRSGKYVKLPMIGTCPTYAAGCFITGQKELVAYDAATGEERWRLPQQGDTSVSPLRCLLDGEEFIMSAKGALIDPRAGKVLWDVDIGRHICVGEGYLVGSGKGGVIAYKISKADATPVWTLKKPYGLSAHRVPAIFKGRLWASRGGPNNIAPVYSVDLASGKAIEPVSFFGGGNPNRSSSSVVMADYRMFLERADLIVLDPSGSMQLRKYETLPKDKRPRNGQTIPGHKGLHVANSATPSIADGRLYVRLDDGLACLDLRQTPKPITRDPAQVAPDPVATKIGLPGYGSALADKREAAITSAAGSQAKKLGVLAVQGRWQSTEAACRALTALQDAGRPAAGSLAEGVEASLKTSPARAALLARTLVAVDPAAAKALAARIGPKAPSSVAACAALAGLGEQARTAEVHLCKALDQQGTIGREALRALHMIGPREEATARRLATLAGKPDVEAWQALVAMEKASLPVLPEILQLLDSPMRGEKVVDLRYWALRVIEQMGPAAAKAAPAVERHILKGKGKTTIAGQGQRTLAAITSAKAETTD